MLGIGKNLETMLASFPTPIVIDKKLFSNCINSCFECVKSCLVCAEACLAEKKVDDLRECIRLNEYCSVLCETTAKLLLRLMGLDSRSIMGQLDLCAKICRSCGEMCKLHADNYEHCAHCAQICFDCEDACVKFLVSMK